jgi:hypothetical protein
MVRAFNWFVQLSVPVISRLCPRTDSGTLMSCRFILVGSSGYLCACATAKQAGHVLLADHLETRQGNAAYHRQWPADRTCVGQIETSLG